MARPTPDPDTGLEALLAEQIAYYRARAPEYRASTGLELTDSEVSKAERAITARLDELAPLGNVLELACGPGTFTAELAARADTVTALDASPEMLTVAGRATCAPNVRFERADLFRWWPRRGYDLVFFGFWLSHVPLERFDAFWSSVAAALRPGGRVVFIDDAFRTPDELIEGERSSTIRRRLQDGTAFRAVKVPHEPADLERRLSVLGWDVTVRPLSGPIFWGVGQRGEGRSGLRLDARAHP